MAGVTIGKVTAIDLDRDSYTGRVTMEIEKRVEQPAARLHRLHPHRRPAG